MKRILILFFQILFNQTRWVFQSPHFANNNPARMPWQITKSSIKERLEYLLKHTIWTDCKVVIEPDETNIKEFLAHSMVLAMSSSKLAAMLKDSDSYVKITNMQPDTFQVILEYLYTDKATLNSVLHAFEVYKAANDFDLPFLSGKCMNFIVENVDCSNAVSVYEYAKSYNCSEIIEKSMTIISKRTTEILSSAQLLSAQYQTLLDILNQNKLNVSSELDLFNAFQSWVLTSFRKIDKNVDVEKLREFATPGLQKIRFLSMTISDFLNGPMKSELLTKDDLCTLLGNITSFQSKFPIPTGFSNDCSPRIQFAEQKVNIKCDLYLPRVVKNPIVSYNNDRFVDVIRFTADDDVQLIGIQVLSQVIDSSTSAALEYDESILISVSESSNTNNRKTDSDNDTSDDTAAPERAQLSADDPYAGPKKPFPVFSQRSQPDKSFGSTSHGNAFPMFPPFGFHRNFAGFGQSPGSLSLQSDIRDGRSESEGKNIQSPSDTTEYTPTVNFNSTAHIKLNKPVTISKDSTYELKVFLNKRGCYQVGYVDRATRVAADNVQFEFIGYADVAFVNCLIFNH